jgi:DNA replication factor GINS
VADNRGVYNGSQAIIDIVNLLKKETQATALQSVPFDIYSNAASTIKALRVSAFEGLEGVIGSAMIELLSDSINLLFNSRYQKMMNYLEAMPNSSGSEKTPAPVPTDYSKMTDEEKYFLEVARDLGKRKIEMLKALDVGDPEILESLSKEVRSKKIVIMFLKPVEQFMGVDFNKYGPFLKEDITALPVENARSLIESKIAMELHSK